MVRSFSFWALLFVFQGTLFSQQTIIYKGIITDAKTKEKIPFATIAIYDNTTLIDGVSSNDNGSFTLKVAKLHTHLEVSFMGYKIYKISIEKIQNHQDISIALKSLNNELDEVVIQAERTTTQLKIDRKVINLGADLQQSGTTALEAFDQITEIQTDLGTGAISLRGAGNVRLLVNGKPSPLGASELLDQIPASYIEKIEIITSPSAKNQANGLSGIINIILKKNIDRGFNFTFNSSIGTKRHLLGFDSNYSFSNVNIRLNATNSKRNTNSKQWIEQNFTNGDTRDFFTPHDFRGKIERISTGMDIFISKKSTLSFQVNHSDNFHSFFNKTFYTNVTNTPDFIYVRNSSHTHKTTDYNINFKKNFSDENHFLEIDYNLTNNENILPAEDFEEDQFLSRELQSNKNDLHAFSLDYRLPGEKTILETGTSWNYRELNSLRDITLPGLETANDRFQYDEHLLGLYGLTKLTSGKLNWQIGLRYEYFHSTSINSVNDQKINLHFSNVFPTVHFSYKFNNQNTLSGGYSKRISRPNSRHINPFQIGSQYFQWNPNPSLRPEFSDNFEVNYLYDVKDLTISLSKFYRYRTNVIQWLNEINTNGVRIVSFENVGTRNSYGIESDFQYKFSKKWNTQLSGNYYYTKANQRTITFDELYSSNILLKNTIKISEIISTDITYRHTPKNQEAFDFTESRNRWDLAIRGKFLENKLIANLRIVDVFDENLRRKTLVLPNVTQQEVWRFQTQTFGWLLSLNYKIF